MAYKKKLIEVALPLQAINEACIKEKSIRHGHPSTLHNYWARRPLAAARAVIFSSLIDDPSNDRSLTDEQIVKRRNEIFSLLIDMIQWKNINNQNLLKKAKQMISESTGGNIPPFLDPFCGAGTIPLEAQRLGLESYGSDLNPLAVMISKATVELPHRVDKMPPINPIAKAQTDYTGTWMGATGLANDVRYYGKWVRDKSFNRISKFYPNGPKNEKVLAWIWTRVVNCPNPSCNAIVPLSRSFQLNKKKGNFISLKVSPVGDELNFEIERSHQQPIIGRGGKKGVSCLKCNSPVGLKYIRSEGSLNRIQNKMMAMITESKNGRQYYPPSIDHIKIASSAQPIWKPDFPMVGKAAENLPLYGYKLFSDIFSKRQLLALSTFSSIIQEAKEQAINDGATPEYANIICTYLAFALDRSTNYWSTLTPWGGGFIVQTFSRQALPMVWDYAEANPFSNSTGNWLGAIEWISKVLENFSPTTLAHIDQVDATKNLLDVESPIICTDPPYYDNVMYADLSDYFYIWLKHSIQSIYPDYFKTLATPKNDEIVASVSRYGSAKEAEEHFLEGIISASSLIGSKANADYPVTFFYAYKQSETNSEGSTSSTGWETFLEGLIRAGFEINATWPMRTERDQGLKTGINALASSIVVALRKKSDNTKLATRREFVKYLSTELQSAVMKMIDSDITPVDLQQSAIGPGMAVYTRFAKVLEADGSKMSVRTALQLINAELDKIQDTSDIDMDSDTRFCLQWFDTYGFNEQPYGEAETLARAKDTSVDGLVSAGVFVAGGGNAKLKHWSEFQDDWDPRADNRLTLWECTHHMIRQIISGTGQLGAARLANFMGNQKADDAKELAYQLYHICDKKGWAKHAGDYNTLVANWVDIKVQVPNVGDDQRSLF